jgi:hypothetical protein
MYNTQFNVKYNDIEQELLHKINNENIEEYSIKDVEDICNKIYRDELMAVFDLHIFDSKIIIQHIDNIYEKLILNTEFKNTIDNITSYYKNNLFEGDINNTLSIILFSQPLFHMTHKCICQHMKLGVIDNQLLSELEISIYKIV